jgi:hypothetical protein
MYLSTDNKSPTHKAKLSKHQPAYFSFKKDYKAIWQFQHPDAQIRLEMEGQPIHVFIYF